MKLLIDARSLGKKPSGIGIYTYNMVKELLKISDCKITLVTDISESCEMKELKSLGVSILEYGSEIKKNFGLWFYYRFIQKCIYQINPDIFWETNSLVPIKMKNPYGKLAVTIHDVFPITYPQYYGKKYELYFKYGLKKTIKNFDLLIYNSKETKEQTEKCFPIAKEKDFYISYIIVPKLPYQPISDNGSFLYIGNLEKRKGTDILLKAFRKYRLDGGNRRLRLGGKIRENEIQILMEQMIKEVGGIDYLGYLNEEERNREYASCHCFIFPSRAEGFGIPIIEVMNYYKPVLVKDLSIYHEIIGECIEYIGTLNKDVSIEEMVSIMKINRKNINKEKYLEVIGKYQGEILGKEIYIKFKK